MAKLSARGHHEVTKITAGPADRSYRALYALRSDGMVLRRLASVRGGSRGGTGYVQLGRLSAERIASLRTGPLTWNHPAADACLARVALRYGDRPVS